MEPRDEPARSARVVAGRLQVPARVAADPHPGIRQRYPQRADARQLIAIRRWPAIRIAAAEALAAAPSAQARLRVADMDQPHRTRLATWIRDVFTRGRSGHSHRVCASRVNDR